MNQKSKIIITRKSEEDVKEIIREILTEHNWKFEFEEVKRCVIQDLYNVVSDARKQEREVQYQIGYDDGHKKGWEERGNKTNR